VQCSKQKSKNQPRVRVSKRVRKINPDELIEQRAEQAWREQLAWLRRLRLHTAIFEDASKDDQTADYWAKHNIVVPEREFFDLRRINRAKEIQRLTKDLGWSNERLAAFKQIVVEYREEPTIGNYVRVRQKFPEVEIQVSRFGGIDTLFALEDKLKGLGINPAMVAAALDSNELSVDALSLRLLELLIAREGLPKNGPNAIENRRNAISDTVVNYLICQMLEGFDWHDETFRVPASLVVLIRHQLCVVKPDLYEECLSRQRRENAAFSLGRNLKPKERLSVRKLAKLADIPPSTAARWLNDKDFHRSVEAARKLTAAGILKDGRQAWKKRILEGGW
jgi:hypothetical protein